MLNLLTNTEKGEKSLSQTFNVLGLNAIEDFFWKQLPVLAGRKHVVKLLRLGDEFSRFETILDNDHVDKRVVYKTSC